MMEYIGWAFLTLCYFSFTADMWIIIAVLMLNEGIDLNG